MNTERTLILVKPDGVQRGLVGEVLRRIEARGYTLVALELRSPARELVEAHYAELADRPYFGAVVDFIMSGPLVAGVFEGVRVAEGVRALAGATDPTAAAAGTIRGDLARSWDAPTMYNVVHASDSPESAIREIPLWFPELPIS